MRVDREHHFILLLISTTIINDVIMLHKTHFSLFCQIMDLEVL